MSNIDGRCEIRLLYLLKILILYIAVCELRRGFALQCFHYTCDESIYNYRYFDKIRFITLIFIIIYICIQVYFIIIIIYNIYIFIIII